MELFETALPWNGTPVRSTGEVRERLARWVPEGLRYHLPRSVTVCADPSVGAGAIQDLLDGAAVQLGRECQVRDARRQRFEAMGLIDQKQIHAALTRAHCQPWVLYDSRTGGLGPLDGPRRQGKAGGMIPCSSMRNHGVGWFRAGDGNNHVWLATARKEGSGWDLDSDIGHESAHAAFAPVPLFAQSIHHELDAIHFAVARSAADLDRDQLTRMCYLLTELAVVAVRGERRETDTGLPLGGRDELAAFLYLCAEVLPGMGFDRALATCERVSGAVDIDAPEAFEIGAAALRALRRFVGFVAVPDVGPVAHLIFNLPDATHTRLRDTDARVLGELA